MDQQRIECYRGLCRLGLSAPDATRLEAHLAGSAVKKGLLAGRVPVWTYSTGTTLFETDGPETHVKAFLDAYSDSFERLCSILAIPALKTSLLAADDICTEYASLEDHVVEPHTEYGAWQDRHLDQLKRSVAILEAGSGDEAAFIACPKCRSNAVDTEQKQTRSADEPMTVFCKCRKCGKRFTMN